MGGVSDVQEWLRCRFIKAELAIFYLNWFLKMEVCKEAEQKLFEAFFNIL